MRRCLALLDGLSLETILAVIVVLDDPGAPVSAMCRRLSRCSIAWYPERVMQDGSRRSCGDDRRRIKVPACVADVQRCQLRPAETKADPAP